MTEKKTPRKPRAPKATYSDGAPIVYTKHDVDIANAAANIAKAKAIAKEIKENRIDQISAIMRAMSTPKGDPTWTPKVGKALAKAWKIPYSDVRKLSAEASDRVTAECADPKEVARKTAVAWERGLLKTMVEEKWSDLAKFVDLGVKMRNAPTQVEVTVQARQPTQLDAVNAVKEMFGEKVSYSGSDDIPQLADGSESVESPPEE